MVNMRTLRAAVVLVIEPDQCFRSLIGASLRQEGHRVVEAADDRTAVEMLGRLRPNLILIDDDMDRTWLLSRLASTPSLAGIPIIAMGGNGDLVRLARAGIIDSINKPFGYTELQASVSTVLALSPEDVAFERERIVALAGELTAA